MLYDGGPGQSKRQIAGIGKLVRIVQRQYAGGDRPNPWDFQQALAAFILSQLLRQFTFNGLNLFVQIFVVIPQTLNQCDQARREFSFAFRRRAGRRLMMAGPLGRLMPNSSKKA